MRGHEAMTRPNGAEIDRRWLSHRRAVLPPSEYVGTVGVKNNNRPIIERHCSRLMLPKARRIGILTVTSGRINLTTGRVAAAHGRFNRIRQVAPVCTPPKACFLGPTRVQIPNGISIVSAVLHSSLQRVPVLYNGHPLPHLKTAPFHRGIWIPI